MSEIKNSFLDLVGNTPLVRVNNLIKKDELKADVLAKLEYFNPAGSVKDRIAKEMILDALEKGLINENTTLIEPTSGNTGIGLSAVATALNLKNARNNVGRKKKSYEGIWSRISLNTRK